MNDRLPSLSTAAANIPRRISPCPALRRGLKWTEDREHWGVQGYRAKPDESVGSAGGDCEDFSIAKYYLLKGLGVPLERLGLTAHQGFAIGRPEPLAFP